MVTSETHPLSRFAVKLVLITATGLNITILVEWSVKPTQIKENQLIIQYQEFQMSIAKEYRVIQACEDIHRYFT